MRREIGQLWPPVLAAACSIAISVPSATGDALWGDEVASARALEEPGLGELLAHVRLTESTPPGWYTVAWTFSSFVDSVEQLRLLSVLFAAAAAALTAAWATRLLGDRTAGSFAGALVALGTTPSTYAGQLRAYALLMLLSVCFGLLVTLVAVRPALLSLLGLAVVTAAGLLTHYFFVFTVLAGIAWLWTARPLAVGRRAATTAVGCGTLAFMPWLPSFLEQRSRGRYGWIGDFDAVSVLTLPGSLFFGADGVLYGVARIVLALGLIQGALVLRRRAPAGGAVVALGLLPLAGAALVWVAGDPVFIERNLLGTAPYLAIAVAASLLRLRGRLRLVAACSGVAIVALAALFAHATLHRTAYDRTARALVDLGWTADAPLIIDAPTGETSLRFALAWYLPGHPALARASPGLVCPSVFAVGHSSTLGRWLSEHPTRAHRLRALPFYDHPVRGRRDGSIVVARVEGQPRPVAIPGHAFVVRGGGGACELAPGPRVPRPRGS